MNTPSPASSTGFAPALQPSVANEDPQDSAHSTTPVVIDSDQVLQGRTAVVIVHRGLYYRLQATWQGKLILTK